MHGAKQLIGRGLVLITLSDLRSIIIYAMIRYADQYSATNIHLRVLQKKRRRPASQVSQTAIYGYEVLATSFS